MLKSVTIFSELKEYFRQDDSHRAINHISNIMDSLRLRESYICKPKAANRKYSVLQVFQLLMLFPLFEVKDAFHYGVSALGRLFNCQKDMFYRFMRNDSVDWRRILYIFNRQFIQRLSVRSDARSDDRPVCLMADDTDLPKYGRRIEFIGRIYSHVDHISKLGFKGLFLERTDGKTQTVLDFALVGERGKNKEKPYGLTREQASERFTKCRKEGEPAELRAREYVKDKQTLLREMVERAIKQGVRFDYLLVDSWFCCKELVRFIVRRHAKRHFLGMIKMGNTKYDTREHGALTASECIGKLEKTKDGIKRCRKLQCRYAEMEARFDGVPVRLFFCKRGKKGKWNGMLTTNTELDFLEAYRIYSMRWAIEVSFSEMKSHLRLGKCEARDFTEQIASISLTVLQYNILTLVKRFDSYETIGGLFGDVVSGTKEFSITDKIWGLIEEVVAGISEAVSVDFTELITHIIHSNMRINKVFAKEYAYLITS